MNAENRSENVFNQTFPTNRIGVLRNIARTCSFCRCQGHIITSCNDQRITNFEETCISQKRIFDEHENSRNNFEQWMASYYLENPLVSKAFAVRKCGSTLRSNVQRNLRLITEYFYYNEISVETPDFVPFLGNNSDLSNVNVSDVILAMVMLSQDTQFINNYVNNPQPYIEEMLNLIVRQRRMNERKLEIETNVIKCETPDESCECNICYETTCNENFVKLNCSHQFCKECVKKTLHTCDNNAKCAYCRIEIKTITISSEDIKNEFSEIIA